jgi:hypothetical protein
VQLVEIARNLRNSDGSARHAALVSAVEHFADAGRQWLSGLPTEVVFCTFSAMRELASIDNDRFVEPVYRRAAAILDARSRSATRPRLRCRGRRNATGHGLGTRGRARGLTRTRRPRRLIARTGDARRRRTVQAVWSR